MSVDKTKLKSVLDKILRAGQRVWHRAEVRSETAFSHRVMDNLRVHGGQWIRIEAPGVPDISFAVSGVEGWIETKIEKEDGRIVFQPLQPAWLTERARHGGGMTWVLVYSPVLDTIRLYSGSEADRLRSITSRGQVGPTPPAGAAAWVGPMAKEHWLELFHHLTLGKVKVC
jgi:hypothetical protein